MNNIDYINPVIIGSITIRPRKEFRLNKTEEIKEEKNFWGKVIKEAVPSKYTSNYFQTENLEEIIKYINELNYNSLELVDGKVYNKCSVEVITIHGTKINFFDDINDAIVFANRISEKTGLYCLWEDPKKAN